MKAWSLFILLFISFMASVALNAYGRIEVFPDTSMYFDKSEMARELMQLRDSIDMTAATIEKSMGKNVPLINDQLDKNLKDLLKNRSEIEKVIEQVAMRKLQDWNSTFQNSLLSILEDKRRDYQRILENVKQVVSSKSFRS